MRLAHISSVSLAIVPLGATLYKCIVASQHEIDMAILLLPSPPRVVMEEGAVLNPRLFIFAIFYIGGKFGINRLRLGVVVKREPPPSRSEDLPADQSS